MKKHQLFSALGLFFGIAAVAMTVWANGSTASSPKSSLATKVEGAQTSLIDITEATFRSKITSDYMLKSKNLNPGGLLLGQYLYSNKKIELDDQLAITIGSTESGTTIDDVSAVKYRLQNPGIYKEVSLENAPKGARVFLNTDSFELGVFWQYEDMYALVVVSGNPSRRGVLQESATVAVRNWEWIK